tara:strand:+ start:456 stop:929 length:474 start_codon:yes stop_codon:yes gene_type:complete
MEHFSEIYNKILNKNRKYEANYKSRLKIKYMGFLRGENDDQLCAILKAYSLAFKCNNISTEDKPKDIVDHLDDKDIVIRDHEIKIEEQSIKIISLEKTVKRQGQKINVMEHKHNKDMNEIREKFKNLEKRNEVLSTENKVMRNKLGAGGYFDDDYMD